MSATGSRRPVMVTLVCVLLIMEAVYGLGMLISIVSYGRRAFDSSFPDITFTQTLVMAAWGLGSTLVMLWCARGIFARDNHARIAAIAAQVGYLGIPLTIDLGMARGCLLLAIIQVVLLLHESIGRWCATTDS